MKKMSMQSLAEMCQVNRSTLYEWMETIPSFWERVNARRQEMAPKSRLAKVHEVWFLSSLQPGSEGYRDRVNYLANFDPNFHMPTEKKEIDIGDGLAEAMGMARQRAAQQQPRKPIEGEIVDAPQPPAAQ